MSEEQTKYEVDMTACKWGSPVMERYIGTKIINARAMTLGDYNTLRGWVLPDNENPDEQGFLVEYTDGGKPCHPDFKGYISWSPRAQFDGAYRPAEGLSFSQALEALKIGRRIARRGWNGKGMFLFLLPGNEVPIKAITEPNLRSVIQAELGEEATHFNGLPSIRMWTHDSTGRKGVLTGWLASQTDMLSDDWEIVGTV